MMNILERLFDLQDVKYKDFHSKLVPNVDENKLIGVRQPKLRCLAKEIRNSCETDNFLNNLPHMYYEESNLHALLINEIKDFKTCIRELERFLPYVDNWATCDSIRPKAFKNHLDELIKHIKIWLNSTHEYTVRFGIEMLMVHFLDKNFDERYLKWVADIKSDEYYINMMIAWYFATALAKKWEKSLPYLEQYKLPLWVHNKTIQKSIESFRISTEHKQYLKTLKNKNGN